MGHARDEAGNIWETDAQGNAMRLVSPAQAAQPQMPADPTFPFKGQQAASGLEQTQASTARTQVQARGDLIDNSIKGATAPFQVAKTQAEATKAVAESAHPFLSPEIRQKALAQWSSAQQIDRILSDMRDKYAKGPGSTHGLHGIEDFLPTPANQAFDRSASQVRGIARNALGLTGGEANTAAEANMNLGGYVPSSANFDGTNEDIFGNLAALRDSARKQAIQTLGGIPDANGNIVTVPENARNAMTQTYLSQGDPKRAAGNMATMGDTPIPPGMQQEYNDYLAKNVHNLDPDAYAAFRAELDHKYGFPSADPGKLDEYRAWAAQAAKAGQQGGTVSTTIPGAPRPLSRNEQQRNNLISNPEMAAVAGFGNMGGFGVPEALAPEQYNALRNNPDGAMSGALALGEIGGSIAGTGGLAKLGAGTIGKAIPRLLASDARSKALRSLATDAAYSGLYGGMTGQNPIESAGFGALGSGAGQLVGRGIGAAVGGAMATPAAQALRAHGIPVTVGQSLGGAAKALEDAGTSIPGVGDMINARRLDGLRSFNGAMLNEAGSPIGAKVQGIGELGTQNLMDQVSQSYDNATAGVSMPLDPQFTADMAAARAAGQHLPPDYAARMGQAMNNRLGPIENGGTLTGDQYQQAMRGLKGYRASAGQAAPGFEQDYRDALGLGMDALTGQMQRGGGSGVVSGLANANEAYKRGRMLQKAVAAAKNGSGSGEIQIFTPAQTNTQAQRVADKFGGTRPMADLIDAAQTALPSRIPDSGTARRLLQAGVGTALTGGAGYSASQGDTGAVTKGAALLGLLALGGTKAGQTTLNKLILDRPDALKRLGTVIRKRKGLLGSASLPFLIEGGQ